VVNCETKFTSLFTTVLWEEIQNYEVQVRRQLLNKLHESEVIMMIKSILINCDYDITA